MRKAVVPESLRVVDLIESGRSGAEVAVTNSGVIQSATAGTAVPYGPSRAAGTTAMPSCLR